MRTSANLFPRLALPLLCLGLAGCATQKTTATVGGGYQEVTRTQRAFMDEPELPRISLEHRGADGKTMLVWPALYGASEIIKGDLALFVGDKAYVEPEKVTHPRLFAVMPPALPLDITDEVLWRWAKANGKKFATAMEKFNTVALEEKNGGVEMHLEFWSDNKLVSDEKDWPEQSDLPLDWSQVSEIMRAVQTKGVAQKDLRWHTPYIGEKF